MSLWCCFPCMHCCVLWAHSSFSLISLAHISTVSRAAVLSAVCRVWWEMCVSSGSGVLSFWQESICWMILVQSVWRNCYSVVNVLFIADEDKRFKLPHWFRWTDSVKLFLSVWKLMNVIHKSRKEGLTNHLQKCCNLLTEPAEEDVGSFLAEFTLPWLSKSRSTCLAQEITTHEHFWWFIPLNKSVVSWTLFLAGRDSVGAVFPQKSHSLETAVTCSFILHKGGITWYSVTLLLSDTWSKWIMMCLWRVFVHCESFWKSWGKWNL